MNKYQLVSFIWSIYFWVKYQQIWGHSKDFCEFLSMWHFHQFFHNFSFSLTFELVADYLSVCFNLQPSTCLAWRLQKVNCYLIGKGFFSNENSKEKLFFVWLHGKVTNCSIKHFLTKYFVAFFTVIIIKQLQACMTWKSWSFETIKIYF